MCRTPAESQSLPPHWLHSGSSVGGLPPSLSHIQPCGQAYLSERANVATETPGDIEPMVQRPLDVLFSSFPNLISRKEEHKEVATSAEATACLSCLTGF